MDRFPAIHASGWLNTDAPPDADALRGKVVLLHAFQMLCPACVAHGVPQAERVHREFAGEGLVVIGLHSVFEHHEAMGRPALEAFVHEYRVTHPVAIDQPVAGDPVPRTMRMLGLRGTPSVLLYDRTGRLRAHQFGRADDLALGVQLGRLLTEAVNGG